MKVQPELMPPVELVEQEVGIPVPEPSYVTVRLCEAMRPAPVMVTDVLTTPDEGLTVMEATTPLAGMIGTITNTDDIRINATVTELSDRFTSSHPKRTNHLRSEDELWTIYRLPGRTCGVRLRGQLASRTS